MSSVDSPAQQPQSSATDMQSMASTRLPFRNKNMNFFFMDILGSAVYGGAVPGECYYAADRVKDGDIDSWTIAFRNLAIIVEAQAQQALAAGHRVSARERFLRAAHYYFTADHYTFEGRPYYYVLWQKSVECFRHAAALADPPIEPVAIPYEGRQLPGYFLRAGQKRQRRPTLLAMSGFDGSAESLYFSIGAGATRRGYHVLAFEGPGQRDAIQMYPDWPFRPDYEKPISAAVDYALSRPEVDPERLALIGFSFGGHLALRGAAYDQRIKALIADAPCPDFGALLLASFPADLRQLPSNAMDESMEEERPLMSGPQRASLELLYRSMCAQKGSILLQRLAEYHFTDLHRITCPTLSLVSEGEGETAVESARDFHHAIPAAHKTLRLFTAREGADAHCQLNNLVLLNNTVCDWLDDLWGFVK
jgi:pimeloyl-ACP methyl ester carboxylesterase